ncbi:MAG: hypothetical protein UY92_C0003G0021 [Candidatus Magasanikbacteria bacterium GW2011_GWA2_56_11]|uniref:Uncharacterized protein n=1 Tax=Candidatus Magasanikbacteria bacterium GW2011_GWA2_56_11 TaxID=1619044 RepID=A0A0G1YHY3_9BACT|nr:MAG: hypothetical protein UY92_C0003G0021 [Candidatus Magasanikbacteria bacterium GW2011_GWA2_56_11]
MASSTLRSLSTLFFIGLSLVFLSGCLRASAPVYRYSDGSGNTYVITGGKQKQLEYVPVKSSQSSSGVYSGGEPVRKAIAETEYADIVSRLESGVQNTAAHIDNRRLTSGLIELEKNGSEKSYILAPASPEMLSIEQALAAALK